MFSVNLMFMIILTFSTMLVISSPSWFCMWMGLEINMMAFIPMLYKHNNALPSESALKYFLVQAFASMMMMYYIITSMFLPYSMNMPFMILSISMGIKLGAAPFHMWFPSVSEGLSWIQNLILMTWQKIAPMTIISLNNDVNIIPIMIIASSIIGSIMAFNQSSLRKLIAYSSISHMSWMLSSMLILTTNWILYMMIYFLTMTLVIILLEMMNSYQITQINMMKSWFMKLALLINLMSMGGFPPLLGFIGKWILLNDLLQNNMIMISFLLILSSWMNLYIYIRIVHQSMHMNSHSPKNQINFNFNKTLALSTLLSISSIMLINLL